MDGSGNNHSEGDNTNTEIQIFQVFSNLQILPLNQHVFVLHLKHPVRSKN